MCQFKLINVYFQIIKMGFQVKENEHFLHHLLFAFNQGSKAAKSARNICALYGDCAITERTAHEWRIRY